MAPTVRTLGGTLMMGRSHATSGAATWLAVCAASSMLGHHPRGTTALVGAATCAGFALLPDADHPGSLVASTFGPASRWVSRWLAAGCAAVQARTRTAADRPAGNDHRTLTHTVLFAVLVGLLVSAVAGLGGRWAVVGTVFVAAGLALRGLLPAKERRQAGMVRRTTRRNRYGRQYTARELQVPWIAVVAAAAALGCAWLPGASWWWLGLPAGLGCLVHCLGDAATRSGCPILWPLVMRGRRWYPVGLPQPLRIHTGGQVETMVVLPLLLVGTALSGWAALVG